jgi:hypothetical protein
MDAKVRRSHIGFIFLHDSRKGKNRSSLAPSGLQRMFRKNIDESREGCSQDRRDRSVEFLEGFAFVVKGIECMANTSSAHDLQRSTCQIVKHIYDISRGLSGHSGG